MLKEEMKDEILKEKKEIKEKFKKDSWRGEKRCMKGLREIWKKVERKK